MTFHYTITTSKTIDEAISSIAQNFKENEFGIIWRLELTDTLKQNGVNNYTHPYHILGVCNPVESAMILGHNPLVRYFLPCIITTYESKGKTNISLPKTSAMIGLINDPELESIAANIE